MAHQATRRFARHYLEMVVAMLLGMVGLGLVSAYVVDLPDRTGIELAEMAAWMTAPMVLWMRVRGHGWRSCAEMAAAMLLPAAGAMALLASGAVTDAHTLLMAEHIAMFPAMLVVMLLRRDEYACSGSGSTTTPASQGSVSVGVDASPTSS
jgi:flagellar biosynthetic protein FliP